MENVTTEGVVFSFTMEDETFYYFIGGFNFSSEQIKNNPNVTTDSIVVFDSSFNRIPYGHPIYNEVEEFTKENIL